MSVKDSYKLYIKFPLEDEYSSYEIIFNSLVITEVLHNDLKNADNSAKCSIIHNQVLEDKLRLISDEGINAYITCNDRRLFTGFVRRNFSFTKDVKVKTTTIELVSPSFNLKRQITDAIRLINPAICSNEFSLIKSVFIAAGYTLGDLVNLPIISTRIPYFSADPESITYYDIINDALKEYGYILDFDNIGLPKVYPLISNKIETAKNFITGINGNIRGTLSQQVAMEKYQKFILNWTSTKTLENSTIFEDTTGATATLSAVIPVPPSQYYGESEAGSIGLYCNYDTPDYELLYAYNTELDLDVSDPARLVLEEFTDYHNKAFIKIYNNSPSLTEYINKFRIRGTAIVKAGDNITKLNNSDGKYAETLSIDSKYIYNSEAANYYINCLAHYYKYNDFNYTVNSYEDYNIGDLVNLKDNNFGEILCRIINKTTNCYTGLFVYKLEGVGEYETSTTVTESEVNGVSGQLTIDKISGTIADSIQEELKDLELVDTPLIYADNPTFLFSVNGAGVTPITQQIETTIHVIQYDEEIDFSFDNIIIPSDWKLDIQYHTLRFTVPAGFDLSNGYIKIPVIYRPVLKNYDYINEDQIEYTNEDGYIYGAYILSDEQKEYTLFIGYSGVRGVYRGPFDNTDNLPTSDKLIIGDYICWTGEDKTESDKSKDGIFLQCALYSWDGTQWVKDNNIENCSSALSDILSVSNADLATNNSTASLYLDHLTANKIFADRLVANNAFIDAIVSNEAFIRNIFASQINILNSGYIQSNEFDEKSNNAGFKLDGEGNFICINANIVNGVFSGSIDSGPLKLNNSNPGIITKNYNAGISYINLVEDLEKSGVFLGSHICTGTFEGINITSIKLEKDANVLTDAIYYYINDLAYAGTQYYVTYVTTVKITINKNYVYTGTLKTVEYNSYRNPNITYRQISYNSRPTPGKTYTGVLTENSNFIFAPVCYATNGKDKTHKEIDVLIEMSKQGFEFSKLERWKHFFKPNEFSAEEETRLMFFDDEKLLYKSSPMPTACEPCPGNINAIFLFIVFFILPFNKMTI